MNPTPFPLIAASALLTMAPPLGAADPPRPNIVFILADDLGIDGVSSYGSEDLAGLTPRLDAMGTDGLRFTRTFAQPICVPSRSQFLSGWHPSRNGAIDNDGSSNVAIPSRVPALPALLRAAGYRTAVVGKDHSIGTLQADWGFDEWLTAGSGQYFGVVRNTNGVVTTDAAGVYFPDAMQTWALDFITRTKPTPENGQQPFFLFYSLMNPHIANQAGSPWNNKIPPVSWNSGETNDAVRYRNQIQDIDIKVGALLDHLTAQGIRNTTLVIFVGDNGTLSAYKSRLWNPASSSYATYQGEKNSIQEGGSLVPLMIEWPGGLAPSLVGSSQSHVIDFTDFFATFLELAGASLPPGVSIDGHSFAGLLTGAPAWVPRRWAHVQLANTWYVRTSTHRMDRNGTLYDMANAPFSRTTLNPASDTTQLAVLRAELSTALASLDPTQGITYEYHQDNRWTNPARAWKVANFSVINRWDSTVSGDLADPDGDNIPNLIERALGSNPNARTTAPSPNLVGPNLAVTYTEPSTASDTRLIPEVSGELALWQNSAAHVQKSGPGTPGSSTTATDLGTGDRRFMRLRAERVTPWTQP